MKLLPKIELHCHLDGSIRKETVLEFLKNDNLDLIYDEYDIESALIAPVDCESLDMYLEKFELPISILQVPENLERVTFEIMEDAAKENVKYIEIRFAPQLHTKRGMDYETIINSVSNGIKKAEKTYQIKGNIILSHLRHSSEEEFIKLIEEGAQFLNDKVVAVDLCGSEEEGFCKNFYNAIKHAKSLGYKITIHAGETGFESNIVEAIEILGSDRIGHGIAMMNNSEVMNLVKEKNIFVECCPTSNIQTKAITDIKLHPINDYMTYGIKTSINTDNRTVSDTNMSNEFKVISDNFDWNNERFKQLYEYSIEATFADEITKEWLKGFNTI